MGEYAVVTVFSNRADHHAWTGPPHAEVVGDVDLNDGLNSLHLKGWDLVAATTVGSAEGWRHYLFLHRADTEGEAPRAARS